MKKLVRVAALMLSLSLLATVTSATGVAMDDVTNSDMVVVPSEREQAIEDLIEQRGELKAALHTTDESSERYNDIMEQLSENQSALDELSAVPSMEMLSQLKIDVPDTMVASSNPLIDDFEDFYTTFGTAYDIYGLSNTINASYGSYDVYEIILQDNPNGNRLTSQITKNKDDMVKVLPSGNMSIDELVQSEILKSTLSFMVDEIVSSSNNALVEGTYKVASFVIGVAHNVKEKLEGSQILDDNSTETTYHVFSGVNATMRFIYVKNTASNTWQHCHTVNEVHVSDTHVLRSLLYQPVESGPNKYVTTMIDKSYSKKIDRFAYRYTDAISNYRSTSSSITYNVIDTHYVVLEYGNVGEILYSLPVNNALDAYELFY